MRYGLLCRALGLAAGIAAAAPLAAEAPSRAERERKAQGYFGDTVLTTQAGKPVRFYSDVLKGRVVLVNFIYTNCEDACPLLVAKLKRVQEELKESFGPDVRFVSISTDPVRDTPKVLAAYARKMEVEHSDWLFLTGRKAEVDAVIKRLGAYSEDVQDHSTAIIIGSTAGGRWKKVRPDTPPEAIAFELRTLVDLHKTAATATNAARTR